MMRNEVLHGYLIHHRKYREKSHIVHLFSQEYGRVDGILRQTPAPQYQPIRVQATGKSELKNFTQLEILHQPVFFHGDAFFAGFYLNEIGGRLFFAACRFFTKRSRRRPKRLQACPSERPFGRAQG